MNAALNAKNAPVDSRFALGHGQPEDDHRRHDREYRIEDRKTVCDGTGFVGQPPLFGEFPRPETQTRVFCTRDAELRDPGDELQDSAGNAPFDCDHGALVAHLDVPGSHDDDDQ